MSFFKSGDDDSLKETDSHKPTRKLDKKRSLFSDEPEGSHGLTRPMAAVPPQEKAEKSEEEASKTKVWRPSRKRHAETPPSPSEGPEGNPMDDPVVGWLVVVKGPGKGAFSPLGYGMNSMGRSPSNRVSLNYGDDEISRDNHATLTYDPRGRKYYIMPGGGQNLAYIDDQPVLVPAELILNQEISLGKTTMRFVPFCGERFDWQDI